MIKQDLSAIYFVMVLVPVSEIVHRMQLLVGTSDRYHYKYSGLGYFDRVKEKIGKQTLGINDYKGIVLLK